MKFKASTSRLTVDIANRIHGTQTPVFVTTRESDDTFATGYACVEKLQKGFRFVNPCIVNSNMVHANAGTLTWNNNWDIDEIGSVQLVNVDNLKPIGTRTSYAKFNGVSLLKMGSIVRNALKILTYKVSFHLVSSNCKPVACLDLDSEVDETLSPHQIDTLISLRNNLPKILLDYPDAIDTLLDEVATQNRILTVDEIVKVYDKALKEIS